MVTNTPPTTEFPVYGRRPAWFGAGVDVSEAENAEDALKRAGQAWTTSVQPAYYRSTGPTPEEDVFRVAPKSYLVVRDDLKINDDDRILGHVGPGYKPIQNTEALSLLDPMHQRGEIKYITSGILRHGAVVWLLAELTETATVCGDELAQYLLLKNVHDGTGSLEVMFTPYRMICHNAIQVARKRARMKINIPHTRRADLAMGEGVKIVNGAKKYFAEHNVLLERMRAVKVTDKKVTEFLLDLYPEPASGRRSQVAVVARQQVHHIYRNASEGHTGTVYGLWQAVTEYIDHAQGIRTQQTANPFEARMKSIMWGTKATKRQDASALLLDTFPLSKD